jgi:GDP-D-mannose 3', 5'-epimerase
VSDRAIVTGAGGFIGHHLVSYLKDKGYFVIGVDLKYPEFEDSKADTFLLFDLLEPRSMGYLRDWKAREIYHLAADMGGIGYITTDLSGIATRNARMDLNMLEVATARNSKFLYASSACVYPISLQDKGGIVDTLDNVAEIGLLEDFAWPAEPEEGYGLEKLFIEKMCQYYHDEKQISSRVARFHNVYGPYGTYEGGKEKVPAALCRKVALAKSGDVVEVWGDGTQSRSFIYVEDCVEGLYRLMQSEYPYPLNIGTEDAITIDGLAHLIIDISGKDLGIKHVEGPRGVYARNSNNTMAKQVLGWEPRVSLRDGLMTTYNWIHEQVIS